MGLICTLELLQWLHSPRQSKKTPEGEPDGYRETDTHNTLEVHLHTIYKQKIFVLRALHSYCTITTTGQLHSVGNFMKLPVGG